jgi:hypothetical protein
MTPRSRSGGSHWRSPWIPAGVALFFAVLFLLLRTQQYTFVDGALRCLAVFHDPTHLSITNNHLLYPFWISVWTRGAALAGFTASDWLSYVRLSQAMNAFCAAVATGVLFSVLATVAGPRYALLGSLQFGLATAVILHATNSAEPVTGLLFSLSALGVLIPALRSDSKIGLFVVGVLLTLALASYQAMALVAPLVAVACVCWPGTNWRLAVKRLALIVVGGALSVMCVYGLAYSSEGIPPGGMLSRFLKLDGGPQTYGGVKPSKLLNVPVGLIRNLFHAVPPNYAGIRSLLKTPHATFWICAMLGSLILLAAFMGLIAAGIVAAVRSSGISKFLLWPGILLSAIAVTFPLLYWDPLYDKLWLLPLAFLAIAAAFAFRFSASDRTRQRLTLGLMVLVIVEGAVNIPIAVEDHAREMPQTAEARDLEAIVASRDAVVLDFDDVSTLWSSIWGYGRNYLLLPASSRSVAAAWLSQAETKEAANGGDLLFVAVLDEDRTAWDAFLGRATGISYAEFECYRQNSVIRRRYPHSEGFIIVRQLTLPSSCPSLPSTIGIDTKPAQ